MFEEYGITFLQNEYKVLSLGGWSKNNIAIAGGVGFAKYNERYNSNTQVGPGNMTHKDDAIEADKLLGIQKKALVDPSCEGTSVIVASHYPVYDWMNEKDISSRYIYLLD